MIIPCPRGDLNTQTREISPDRGNHGTRVTGAGPAYPGIRPGVRYLSAAWPVSWPGRQLREDLLAHADYSRHSQRQRCPLQVLGT
jgi:hypothetical protein